MNDWGATHILAYEVAGKMVEVAVRKELQALSTKEEWAAHAVPDWTFEDDGRLYYCGIDYAAEKGKCTLRLIGTPRLSLDSVLFMLKNGCRNPFDMSHILKRSVVEVETSLATLERLGKVVRDESGSFHLSDV